MFGFSASDRHLTTQQHGAFCSKGAGPQTCEVVYRWNEQDRTLEVERRALLDGNQVELLAHDYNEISR